MSMNGDCGCTDCACKQEKLTPKEELKMLEEYKAELAEEIENVNERIKKLSAE